ncbi:MAG: TIGR04551 family protein, partial [Myxococcota bacterium]
ADVDGLSSREDTVTQQNADTRLTTFAFHPAYQIDMILWRRIMGRFAGAYYLKPSISYDILRNVHGRLLGFRTALIYSRAAQEVQTYGSDPHLGIELNAALYYRSESGPSFYDGFVAEFQYGVLFPGPGLGYPSTSNVEDQSLSNAQALRLILGIEF